MIYILIKAFNAEKTLHRAVNSIINQTYKTWSCYIINNGSSDKTGNIADEYSQRDSRIITYHIKENHPYFSPFEFPELPPCFIEDNDYFCTLDSDDEYKSDFLEEIVCFTEMNNLDLAVCGSEFVDANDNNKLLEQRKTKSNLLITDNNLMNDLFPDYYVFMHQMWGKMYKGNIIKEANKAKFEGSYGKDTYFIFETLRLTTRIGILSKTLHIHYISNKPVSYTFDNKRIFSDNILYDQARDFLISKCGNISKRNEKFLLFVYMDALMNTLNIFIESNLDDMSKLDIMYDMFICNHIKRLAALEHFDELPDDTDDSFKIRTELFNKAAQWLLSRNEVSDEQVEKYCELGEFLCASLKDSGGWIAFKKLKIRYLLNQECYNKVDPLINELKELIPEDEELLEMIKENNQITGTSSVYNNILSRNGCDDEFYDLIDRIKTEKISQLLKSAENNAAKWLETDSEYYGLLLKKYKSWYRVNCFGQDKSFVNYFGGMYNYLKQNANELIELYESLADYRSKYTLKIIVQHWLTFHPDLRKKGCETLFEHYFDLDIIKCDENEIFVDCGCYIGDTVLEYIRQYGDRYKSIYSYELTRSIYEKAKDNLKNVKRLYLRNAGVSDKNGKFPMFDLGEESAANRLNVNGNLMAKTVRIDDDIQEAITFLKMDVEGAEIDALRGAENQIRNNKPKLAISLYHKLSDLIEIPRLIKSFVPEYKFYLRHTPVDFPFPTEYVLFAVMPE